jgi:molybdopterin-containing oxidoreductase family iron-sulfur binding subunit
MVYNRCIGTRYCANNCPFKVRRFNYFNYNADIGVGYGIDSFPGNIESANRKLQALVMNPEVTVRGRGVMEKCTYCVQRIEKAKIESRKDGGRQIEDGDVVTACQAACPSKAIEFGNLTNPKSAVSKQHADPRSYGMLSQLNVKPRTEYLARVRNTPRPLMTTAQIKDLETITAPHHGSHDDHGGHDDHGSHKGHEGEHHGDGHHEGEHHEGEDHKKEAAHG